MRLTDLDPRWVMQDGKKVGFVFQSPTLGDDMWICFWVHHPDMRETWACINQAFPEGRMNKKGFSRMVQTLNPKENWVVAGGLENSSFETMTITPSLDCSPANNWHGYITNGEIVGGI